MAKYLWSVIIDIQLLDLWVTFKSVWTPVGDFVLSSVLEIVYMSYTLADKAFGISDCEFIYKHENALSDIRPSISWVASSRSHIRGRSWNHIAPYSCRVFCSNFTLMRHIHRHSSWRLLQPPYDVLISQKKGHSVCHVLVVFAPNPIPCHWNAT